MYKVDRQENPTVCGEDLKENLLKWKKKTLAMRIRLRLWKFHQYNINDIFFFSWNIFGEEDS